MMLGFMGEERRDDAWSILLFSLFPLVTTAVMLSH